MASIRSKLLNSVTRLSMRLLLRREVSVPQFRQLVARSIAAGQVVWLPVFLWRSKSAQLQGDGFTTAIVRQVK